MSRHLPLKYTLPLILGLIIFGYTAWQLRHIVGGPNLTITTPATGIVLTEPTLALAGYAKNIDWLYLNGRQIFTDQAGRFDETLLAAPGYNILTLIGKDKFGRMTTKILEVVYQNNSNSDQYDQETESESG